MFCDFWVIMLNMFMRVAKKSISCWINSWCKNILVHCHVPCVTHQIHFRPNLFTTLPNVCKISCLYLVVIKIFVIDFRSILSMNSVCIMFPNGEAARILAARKEAAEF